jgi:hypothetical protein
MGALQHDSNEFDGRIASLKDRRLKHCPVDTYGSTLDMEAMYALHFLAGQVFDREDYVSEQRMEAAKWAMFVEMYTGMLRVSRSTSSTV